MAPSGWPLVHGIGLLFTFSWLPVGFPLSSIHWRILEQPFLKWGKTGWEREGNDQSASLSSPIWDSNMPLYSRECQFSTSPRVHVYAHTSSDLLSVLSLPTASTCSSSLQECPQPTGALCLHKRKAWDFMSPRVLLHQSLKAQLTACSRLVLQGSLGTRLKLCLWGPQLGLLAFPVLPLPLCSPASP